jgi:diphosphomevalonate decarboxylase
MILEYRLKSELDQHKTIDLTFSFEGKENKVFGDKIKAFFTRLLPSKPYLGQLTFHLSSSNSFPHSAGIASSASSMSALALCICALENRLFQNMNEVESLKKASYLARLASGSACRSLFPEIASWGESAAIPDSSNLFGTPHTNDLHPLFKTYKDAILLVSKKEKDVSSRAGHKLMEDNPYATVRYAQAKNHLVILMAALKNGDLDTFIQITESEAMTLHALMMSSSPYFLLLEPNTIMLIKKIRSFRENTNIPVCFTLDAGPNIHLLYPEIYQEKMNDFIEHELLTHCEQHKWIADQVGKGPFSIF